MISTYGISLYQHKGSASVLRHCFVPISLLMTLDIENAIQELIEKVSVAQPQIDHLILQVQDLESQLSTLSAHCDLEVKAKQVALNEVQALQREKAQALDELDQLLLQLHQLQEAFQHLVCADSSKQRQLDDEKSLRKVEANRVVVLTQELSESTNHINCLEEKCSGAVGQLAALEEAFSAIRVERDSLVRERAEATQMIEKLKQQMDAQSTELQNALADLEYYFVVSSQQSSIIQDHLKLQERTINLLANAMLK